MVAKFFIYVVFWAAGLIPLGLWGWSIAKPRLQMWQLRRRASKRMEAIEPANTQLCLCCDHPTNPTTDVYDKQSKRWVHALCWNRLLGPDKPHRKELS